MAAAAADEKVFISSLALVDPARNSTGLLQQGKEQFNNSHFLSDPQSNSSASCSSTHRSLQQKSPLDSQGKSPLFFLSSFTCKNPTIFLGFLPSVWLWQSIASFSRFFFTGHFFLILRIFCITQSVCVGRRIRFGFSEVDFLVLASTFWLSLSRNERQSFCVGSLKFSPFPTLIDRLREKYCCSQQSRLIFLSKLIRLNFGEKIRKIQTTLLG